MAPANPEVGHKVMHHGHIHEITALPERARMVEGKPTVVRGITFRRKPYTVTAMLDDNVMWSEDDQAWYLIGRVLCRNERALCEAITGSWPPAANHMAMRAMLDSVKLEDVNLVKFTEVLFRRKADIDDVVAKERLSKDDTDEEAQRKREQHASADIINTPILLAYAEKALAQCAELRANRQEALNHG